MFCSFFCSLSLTLTTYFYIISLFIKKVFRILQHCNNYIILQQLLILRLKLLTKSLIKLSCSLSLISTNYRIFTFENCLISFANLVSIFNLESSITITKNNKNNYNNFDFNKQQYKIFETLIRETFTSIVEQ